MTNRQLAYKRDRTYRLEQVTMFDIGRCLTCSRAYSNNISGSGRMFCNIYVGPKSIPKLVSIEGTCDVYQAKVPVHNVLCEQHSQTDHPDGGASPQRIEGDLFPEM